MRILHIEAQRMHFQDLDARLLSNLPEKIGLLYRSAASDFRISASILFLRSQIIKYIVNRICAHSFITAILISPARAKNNPIVCCFRSFSGAFITIPRPQRVMTTDNDKKIQYIISVFVTLLRISSHVGCSLKLSAQLNNLIIFALSFRIFFKCFK